MKGSLMRHPNLLNRDSSALLIVDIQENFRRHLADVANLTRNITIMAEAAKILNLPVIVTEQYPQGLGHTIAEINACLGEHKLFDKMCFSSLGSEDVLSYLRELDRKQIIVCGIEAHVCVSQTVHDLLANGFQPHLLIDAVSSRNPKNRDMAIQKMLASGAIGSSVEMSLFEMMVEAGSETFKSVQRLIR